MKEEFRWIYIGNEKTLYEISNLGNIISYNNKQRKPKLLKPHVMESGYNIVCIYHNDKEYWRYIHRLVATAFIPIPEKYRQLGLNETTLEVNHINGTFQGKSINACDNLEWVTSGDNKHHAYRTGLKKQGEESSVSIYTDEQILEVCKLLQEDKLGNRAIWKKTGASVTTIQAILSGHQWKSISKDFDFSNHTKRKIPYTRDEINRAKHLLQTSDLSLKDIGDVVGMTRNAVWYLRKKMI